MITTTFLISSARPPRPSCVLHRVRPSVGAYKAPDADADADAPSFETAERTANELAPMARHRRRHRRCRRRIQGKASSLRRWRPPSHRRPGLHLHQAHAFLEPAPRLRDPLGRLFELVPRLRRGLLSQRQSNTPKAAGASEKQDPAPLSFLPGGRASCEQGVARTGSPRR